MPSLYDFEMTDIDGEARPLSAFEGRAVLVVNVASRCGLTPQYAGLQQLYETYRERGLEVIGFPCNQFAGQEPASEAEIRSFCSTSYGVSFPLSSKIDVNGETRDPLYAWLCASEVGPDEAGDVKWNFGKFLIARDGQVAARFSPRTDPAAQELTTAIEAALG